MSVPAELLTVTGIVTLAEIGDKTQLLALMLAACYGRSMALVLGIFCATLLNHAIAGAVGLWLGEVADAAWLQWIVAGSFIAVGLWVLKPDHLEESCPAVRHGLFWTSFVLFFIAEMGDKTQVATVILAAHYEHFLVVLAGTTVGMMLANIPAVWLGKTLCERVQVKWIRRAAAALFAAMGVATLLQA